MSRSHVNLRLVKDKFLIHSAFLFVLQTEGFECTNENKQHSQGNKFSGKKTILTYPYKMFLRGLRAGFGMRRGPGPQKVWEPLV